MNDIRLLFLIYYDYVFIHLSTLSYFIHRLIGIILATKILMEKVKQ